MSWLSIRKLICLRKDEIKFTYKEEHKPVLILVFPVAIWQPEKLSDLSDLLSVPEFPTRDSELLPANETLPATETLLSKHREKRHNECPLVLVETHKGLHNHLIRILMPDYEVVSVCDVETAFMAICEQHPDAVLASSAPVGVSGEEPTVRTKSDDRAAHVPVILFVRSDKDSKETQRNVDLYATVLLIISFLKVEIESLIISRETIHGRYIRLALGVGAPDGVEANVPLLDGDQEFTNLMRSLIERGFTDSRFTINELGDCANIGRSSFYNRIKEIIGHAPADYACSVYLNKALILLMSRKYTAVEVVDTTGFGNPKYFRTVFKKHFGDSPTKYISNL